MKVKNIISIILNLLTVAAVIVGILICFGIIAIPGAQQVQVTGLVAFFSVFSALFIGVAALIGFIGNIFSLKTNRPVSSLVFGFRLMAAVSGIVTFIFVLVYLLPTGSTGELAQKIILYFIIPLMLTATVMFLDVDKRWSFKLTFLGPVIVIVYIAYTLPLTLMGVWQDVYEFASYFTAPNWWKGLLLIAILVFGSYGIGALIWLVNRVIYLIFVGDSVDEEITEEEEAIAKVVEVTKEDEAIEEEVVEEVKSSGYIGPRVYHISRHKQDDRWQVKFANGKRALKVTNTQAEAIVYAKQLIKANGGSLRVHSVKGRIRKA